MQIDANKTRDYQRLRREAVKNTAADYFPDVDPQKLRFSQYTRLMDAITEAALEYVVTNNIELDEYSTGPIDDAIDLVNSIRYSLDDYTKKDGEFERNPNFWHHRTQPFYDVKQNKVPHISRADLEGATGTYLDLPFHCAQIDRILIDLLVALEMYQYGDEMYNQPYLEGIIEKTVVQDDHPIKKYFKGILYYGGKSIVGAIAAAALGYIHIISPGWTHGLEITAGIYFFGSLFLATLAMFYVVPWHNKRHKEVTDLMGAMIRVYSELSSEGPISVPHLQSRLQEATAIGVVWPAPLYALLDDINKRTGRI